jgi:hypothetical protein
MIIQLFRTIYKRKAKVPMSRFHTFGAKKRGNFKIKGQLSRVCCNPLRGTEGKRMEGSTGASEPHFM